MAPVLSLGETFTTLYGSSEGGAVAVAGEQVASVLTLYACNLTNNRAPDGGALSALGMVSAQVSNCNFLRNTARLGGAVGLSDGARLSADACVFEENNATVSVEAPSVSSSPAAASAAVTGPGATPICRTASSSLVGASAATGAFGGALWLGIGGSANVTNCRLNSNTAETGGAALAVSSAAGIALRGCSLYGNSASPAGGGGAVALLGATAFSATTSPVVNNSALLGGFLAFFSGAQNTARVSLSAMTFQYNAATAGTLYAIADGAGTFAEPGCTNGCTVLLRSAAGYGDRLASLPDYVAVPSGNRSLRPGERFTVEASLYDSFGQRVLNYPVQVATVECVSVQAADGSAQPCGPAALRGQLTSVYTCARPLAPPPSRPPIHRWKSTPLLSLGTSCMHALQHPPLPPLAADSPHSASRFAAGGPE